MATAEKLVRQALFYEGVTEDPKGSNNVIFNTDYYGHKVNGSTYAWCVVFVWDMFRIAGASHLFYNGKKVANTVVVETWGKSSGLTVPKEEVKRGDLVLFDFNHNGAPDHIGFALGPAKDGKVETIEGNTDDMVARRSRDLSDVCTVIRPEYDTCSCTAEDCPILAYLASLIKE